MGGDTQKVTNTSQNTAQSGTQTGQTTPWDQTNGILSNLLAQLGGTSSGTTDIENDALANLNNQGVQGNQFAGQIGDVASQQLTGGPDRSGVINDAYSQYQKLLTPFAQGQYVDPSSNPELQNYLNVARSDASNSVRSQFAGAGRDMSGYEQQAEARGVGQAEAPILYDAYNQGRNQQLSSISGLLSGGLSTSAGLSANDAQRVATQNSGINASNAATSAQTYGPLLRLAAAAQQRGIPLDTLAKQFGLTLPAAQAFGTTSGQTSATGTGTGTSTETTQVPLFDKLLSAGALGGALYGKFGPSFSSKPA